MSKTLIEKTRQIWHERSKTELTEEGARQILDDGVRFFSILQEWDAKEQAGITIASDPKNIYRIESPRPVAQRLNGQQKGAA